MAETSRRFTPYHYASNNPINRIDPDGMKDRKLGPDEQPGTQTTGNSVQYSKTTTTTAVSRTSKTIVVNKTQTGQYGKNSNTSKITGSSSNISNVSDKSAKVIANSMEATGENSVQVTSTTRTPEKQAGIMYDNIQNTSVSDQKTLYGANGDKVIDVYSTASAEKGATATTVKSAMTDKINDLGPQTVSKHCGDPTRINVIDIAPSSVSNVSNFQNNLRSNPGVSNVIPYPRDPAIHVEIDQ